MTLRYLFVLFSFILLHACNLPRENVDGASLVPKKMNEAAGYNVQLGLEYLKQGNIPRAKRKLLRALKQAPGSPDALAAIAFFMEKTGEPEKANTYYQKAVASAPGRGSQLNNYGAFLCRQGRYQQAEQYFLKAVKDIQYEHTAKAYENAGLCAKSSSDSTKARSFFIQALRHDPSLVQSRYELTKLGEK